MEVFAELFNSWMGILSLGVVLTVIGIAVFFLMWFRNKALNDESGS